MLEVIILIFVVAFVSGVFSGIEAALFSVPLSRARILVEKKRSNAPALLKIKKKPSRPLAVVVISNNVVNIVGSMAVGFAVTKLLGSAWLGGASAVLTLLVILLGEIMPKNIGINYAEGISLFIARPLLWASKILTPLLWFIEKFTNLIRDNKKIISEEEIKILSHLSHLEGAIEKDEKEMIHNVFRLNDITAKDIMTPRNMIFILDGAKRLGEVEEKIYKSPYSRIPIYEESRDNIVGLCLKSDLLTALARDKKDKFITDFRRPVMRVSEKSRVDYLLLLFKKKKNHLAMVHDEFKTILGLVTLEDVLEELVGEIVDEKDVYTNIRREAKINESFNEARRL